MNRCNEKSPPLTIRIDSNCDRLDSVTKFRVKICYFVFAVRWSQRDPLAYEHVAELLTERVLTVAVYGCARVNSYIT